MPTKEIFRVVFLNQGQVYEIYARRVAHGEMLGFVEVEGLLFGERATVVVDPAEERLALEFQGVQRFFVPVHAVVRIDAVEKRGPSRITAAPKERDNLTPFPSSIVTRPTGSTDDKGPKKR